MAPSIFDLPTDGGVTTSRVEGGFSNRESLYAGVFDLVSTGGGWCMENLPLLRGLLVIFDLPGNIATKHVRMCAVLCEGGAPCFGTKDAGKFLKIDRATIVSYILSTSLYLFVIAVPVAGAIFGTWLALTSPARKHPLMEISNVHCFVRNI